MKRLMFASVVALTVALGGANRASATTFSLDDCNSGSGLSNPCGPIGTVTETYNSGSLTVTVTPDAGFAFGSGGGADALLGWEFTGFDGTAADYTVGSFVNLFGPLVVTPTMDGFSGDINLGLDSNCSPNSPCSTLSFTISGPGITSDTAFTPFVVHFVQLGEPGQPNLRTGFVESTGGGGGSPVPEPASVALLGSGLLIAARRLRRRIA